MNYSSIHEYGTLPRVASRRGVWTDFYGSYQRITDTVPHGQRCPGRGRLAGHHSQSDNLARLLGASPTDAADRATAGADAANVPAAHAARNGVTLRPHLGAGPKWPPLCSGCKSSSESHLHIKVQEPS